MSKRGSRATFHALWHTILVQSAAGTLLLRPMTDQAHMCRPSSNSYWQRAFRRALLLRLQGSCNDVELG